MLYQVFISNRGFVNTTILVGATFLYSDAGMMAGMAAAASLSFHFVGKPGRRDSGNLSLLVSYPSIRRSTRVASKPMTREEFLARPVDEEWERARRKETADLKRRRREEDKEEKQRMLEYRQVGSNLKNYPAEVVNKARRLVANLIKSGEDVEQMIEEAADNEELTPVVLMVVKTRLEIARQDDERDAVQALDLLFRRIEYEIMKRQASLGLQFLNELLNLHDGSDHDEWLKRARHAMLKRFPPEGAFSIIAPLGFDLSKQTGPIDAPPEEDDVLLRIDFIREVDQLIADVGAQPQPKTPKSLDPDSVALRLKQEEKKRTMQCIKDLRNLAATLKW